MPAVFSPAVRVAGGNGEVEEVRWELGTAKMASKVKKSKTKQLNSGEDDESASVNDVHLSGKKHGIDVADTKSSLKNLMKIKVGALIVMKNQAHNAAAHD